MGKTVTLRLTKGQEMWLDRTSRSTGRPRGQIVREQIEKARGGQGNQSFMRLAGAIRGTPGLSQRKGFARA